MFFVKENDTHKIINLFEVKLKIKKNNDPVKLIKKRKWKFEFQIETTSFCNAKCSFCPNSTLIRKKNFMEDEVFNKIIERIKKEKLEPEKFILHLNGEPLTDKKLPDRIKLLKENFKNAKVRFTTNLCLASEENLTQILNAGPDKIIVSMNSIDPVEYKEIMGLELQKTLDNLKLLFELKEKLKKELQIFISIVARQDNEHMVEEFKKRWGGGVNSAEIRVIKLGTWVNKENKIQVEENNNLTKTPCSILYKTISFLSNGDYALCCFDSEGIIKKNVMKDEILKTYLTGEFKRIRNFQKKNGRINKECKNCSFS